MNRGLAGERGEGDFELKFYLEWRHLSTGAQGLDTTREMALGGGICYNFPLFAPPSSKRFFP
jgi:hypothetical protein